MPDKVNKPNKTGREGNRKLWILIPILLMFVSITSFLAGTQIGRATDHRLGQMLDTIVLSPGSAPVQQNIIDFSGQIFYTDGTPCANQLVELHSDPMRTTTDSKGIFYFKNVETGEHKLAMLDDSGKALNQLSVHINRDSGVKAGELAENDSVYQLSVSEDTIQIHIRIQLDEKEQMVIEPEIYTKASDGIGRDSSGHAVDFVPAQPEKMTENIPESNEGKVANENLPQNTDGANQQQRESLPSDAAGKNPAGSSGAPSQEVPGSAKETEGTSPALPELPSAGTTQAESSSAAKSEPSKENETKPDTQKKPDNDKNNGGDDSDSNSGHARPTTPSPTIPEPTDPSPTEPEPTNPADPLDVKVQEKSGQVWTQNTTISLFADRTGAGEDRKLMPGSKGSYEFSVNNGNSYGVGYRMKISAPEGQLLLPLRYRLKSDGSYICGDNRTWLTAGELASELVILSPGGTKDYCLEWQWLFEGGDDELDTRIGTASDLEYHVIVTIMIEQLVA